MFDNPVRTCFGQSGEDIIWTPHQTLFVPSPHSAVGDRRGEGGNRNIEWKCLDSRPQWEIGSKLGPKIGTGIPLRSSMILFKVGLEMVGSILVTLGMHLKVVIPESGRTKVQFM